MLFTRAPQTPQTDARQTYKTAAQAGLANFVALTAALSLVQTTSTTFFSSRQVLFFRRPNVLTPFDNLDLGPSPSGSVTENLASLPDFALLALANGTTDINVARMVVQELYLRLELRAWTDLEPQGNESLDIPPGEGIDVEEETVELPAPLAREEYETSLLRARRDSARGYPYGD